MIFVGIDPGVTGALAAIHGQDVVMLADAPVVWAGKRRIPAVREMDELLVSLRGQLTVINGGDICVAIEKQQAMPKQGVVSMFGLGRGYGIWEGLIAARHWPYTLVSPRDWHKVILCGMPTGGKQSKGSARIVAGRLFPLAETRLGERQSNDRSDALLIAEYARRTMGDGR
jgi:crossover junction endodeoxyribonuclease RuvC